MRFVTLTEQELLDRLKSVEEQIAAGSRILSAGSGDVSTTKQLVNSLEMTWRRIYMGLHRMNPAVYPIEEGDIPVTITRATFSGQAWPWYRSNY